MGKLTTHVLDTMHGTPAAGMRVSVHRLDANPAQPAELLGVLTLNADGRADGPLLEGEALTVGRYRLSFEVGAYFMRRGVALPKPAFLDVVPVEFGIADPTQHYHVALLSSRWQYATYRGS